MKAVTFHAIGDIRVEDVPEPKIEDPKHAIKACDERQPGWIKVELELAA